MKQIEIILPSPLFPFQLDDLDQFHYGGYTLTNVFRKISRPQKEDAVKLWLRNRVIPTEQAAWARSNEICYFITETASGRLAGVNTLYPEAMQPGGPVFFKNRMFVGPLFRNSRLMITATAATLCYGKTRLGGEGKPGIININENPKLGEKGMRKIFSRLGYQYQGIYKGQDVWLFPFDRVVVRGRETDQVD